MSARIAQPDSPADTVIALRISGNALVRILNAAQARAARHGDAELAGLINAARDELAEQRRFNSIGDEGFQAIAAAHMATTDAGNTLCRLRDACRERQDSAAAPDHAAGWKALAERLEALAVAAGNLR